MFIVKGAKVTDENKQLLIIAHTTKYNTQLFVELKIEDILNCNERIHGYALDNNN